MSYTAGDFAVRARTVPSSCTWSEPLQDLLCSSDRADLTDDFYDLIDRVPAHVRPTALRHMCTAARAGVGDRRTLDAILTVFAV